jgi:putative IMPACT (imprinted ancient) family translation regulator
MDYLTNVEAQKPKVVKFRNARHHILAYRVNQLDPDSHKEVLAEGFDDDGEDGAGEKLLGVLQKLDIGNIMVIVCIWKKDTSTGDSRMNPGELYREINERARELLTGIKQSIISTGDQPANRMYKGENFGAPAVTQSP